MRGSTHSWIEDVLRQRTQEDISPEVTSGVPRGTVLDPLLFRTLINDVSDCVSSSLILFADDCLPHMWISGPEDAQDAQYLDRLQPWGMDWQMYSNPSKCQGITITTNKNQPSYNYFIHGLKLEITTSATSANLTCNRHVHCPVYWKKANRVLVFLRRNTYACPPSSPG